MSATLKLTHTTIGVEVRRGTYHAVVDGKRVGAVELNQTIDIPVEAGCHTLQVGNGRNSSRARTFEVAEGEIVSFRCSGKSILPVFSYPSSFPAWQFRSRPSSAGHRACSASPIDRRERVLAPPVSPPESPGDPADPSPLWHP